MARLKLVDDSSSYTSNPEQVRDIAASLNAVIEFFRCIGGPPGAGTPRDKIAQMKDLAKKALKQLEQPTCDGKVVEIDGKKYELKEVTNG